MSPGRRPHAAVALLLALAALAVLLVPAGGSARRVRATRVTLCHREGGPSWVRITVAAQAAVNGHARNHDRDIIPPFTWSGGDFPGQNWDAEGQAIFQRGCVGPPAPAPIHPRVTCVDPAPDGTLTAVFGYASENAEPRAIAAGPDNGFDPAPADRGQPTSFDPGVLEEAVRVAGIPPGGSLTWTIRSAGVTSRATARAGAAPACSAPPPSPPQYGVFVSCVDRHADGTFDATFGYQNDEPLPLDAPVGAENRFLPAPADRGQPATLAPGRTPSAVTVRGIPEGQRLLWRVALGGVARQALATASFPARCQDPPEPPPVRGGVFATCVTVHADGTYDATFGYENPNAFTIEVPVGYGNRVTPEPADRGQPTVFPPGTVAAAFTVRGVAGDVATRWTLAYLDGTATATATRDFPSRCESPPAVPATVGVFQTCVQRHANGSYDASFGYENLGAREVTVPAGAGNAVEPGGPDRGQPTTFSPGSVAVAFTVTGIAAGDAATWRLATPGAGTATASSDPSGPPCATSPPAAEPDLRLDKRATPSAVSVGGLLRYRITVRNAGDAAALHVVVADRLAANVALVSLTDPRRCRARGRVVTCRLGTLPAGASTSVGLVVRVLGGDEVRNGAVVGGGGDASTAEVHDRASVRTPVLRRTAAARCVRRAFC